MRHVGWITGPALALLAGYAAAAEPTIRWTSAQQREQLLYLGSHRTCTLGTPADLSVELLVAPDLEHRSSGLHLGYNSASRSFRTRYEGRWITTGMGGVMETVHGDQVSLQKAVTRRGTVNWHFSLSPDLRDGLGVFRKQDGGWQRIVQIRTGTPPREMPRAQAPPVPAPAPVHAAAAPTPKPKIVPAPAPPPATAARAPVSQPVQSQPRVPAPQALPPPAPQVDAFTQAMQSHYYPAARTTGTDRARLCRAAADALTRVAAMTGPGCDPLITMEAHFYTGMCLVSLGERRKAATAFLKARAHTPSLKPRDRYEADLSTYHAEAGRQLENLVDVLTIEETAELHE